ncbi:MAG TPA: M20/M25/M40 family metallo-hydrolase [Firmicutes bacterium]|nr:M20/M25/M40 family metallo-hydrolase [Bacillota bacterium]
MHDAAISRLSKAVTYATVSNRDESQVDWSQFTGFHRFLEESYPLVHKAFQREVVGKASLLYRWKGTGKGKPFAFLAHMDVVPVPPEDLPDWKYPPFSGYNDGTYIWGRGAADMKVELIAILETLERLIGEGFVPTRDLYLCFGHNEEVMAEPSGAQQIADLLKERGVELEFVLEEAGVVMMDPPFGLKRPLAMIGVAEKGYGDLEITLKGEGGHSAEPEGRSVVEEMARLVTALYDHPLPYRITPTVETYVKGLAGELSPQEREALSSREAVCQTLRENKKTHAMVRTTIVPTVVRAGMASNAIPSEAAVLVNARLLPGDTMDTVTDHIRRLADDLHLSARLQMRVRTQSPPPPETPTDTPTYGILKEAYRLWDERLLVVPYIVTGGTDSKHYTQVTREIYRISPFRSYAGQPSGAHGKNEHTSIQGFLEAQTFLRRVILMENSREA